MRKTKIVCTLGPAVDDCKTLTKLFAAGMNVARINFSHATMEERVKVVDSVRKVRKLTGKSVALLWDTKGPEFRSGVLENDSIEISSKTNNQSIIFTNNELRIYEEKVSEDDTLYYEETNVKIISKDTNTS